MEIDLGHVSDRETFSFQEKLLVTGREHDDLPGELTVNVEVSRNGNRYLLEAGLICRLKVECDRCLEPFDYVIDTGFKLLFQRGEKVQLPAGITEDDFILLNDTSEFGYDIFPRVKEAVLIELPIRFLCREDCAGLCSGCGANLNRGACACTRKESDPRWGPLKELWEKKKDD
ncbi:MAG: DUF177 domain-containing protein [Candidatus Krumholzibacteriota bacterium]|nr:DUF177 domain-containing protein [Candidatus Krumholzibacteriota bacterium]